MDNLVIYHENCNDGFGSALVAWLVFKDNASYYAASHHTKPPDVTDKNVYICDFSYSKGRRMGATHSIFWPNFVASNFVVGYSR